MQFHVTIKVHDAIVLDADQRLRQVLGGQLQKVLESGKAQGGGFLGGARGAFLLLDVGAPEDLYAVLGPEIYSTCAVEAHPVISWEKGAAIFQQWADAGR